MIINNKYVIHFDTGRSWRGGQNQVYLLINGLKKFGIRQLLVTPKESPLQKKIQSINIDYINLDPKNDLDILNGIRLRRIVKKEKPDIIHFHTSKSLGIGNWALRGLRIKSVFTRRIDLPISKNPLNLFKYKYPDSIVVIANFIKDYMLSIGLKNITKIYSSVDLDKFHTKENINEAGELNIGMVGALDLRHKDFITYINSTKYVIDKLQGEKKVNFLIAGTGKDKYKIKKCIENLNLEDHVKICGFIPEIEKFISSLDILVHTVNFEGLGTIILQAMAAGVPVIATAVGGIPELINDGENGYLVAKKNHLDTAKKIIGLIEYIELRRKFRIKGRKLIETKFAKERMVEEHMKLYERMV